jgi:hypothetical protein
MEKQAFRQDGRSNHILNKNMIRLVLQLPKSCAIVLLHEYKRFWEVEKHVEVPQISGG